MGNSCYGVVTQAVSTVALRIILFEPHLVVVVVDRFCIALSSYREQIGVPAAGKRLLCADYILAILSWLALSGEFYIICM